MLHELHRHELKASRKRSYSSNYFKHIISKTIAFKRNPSGRTRIYEYTPPPPPPPPNYRSSYGPAVEIASYKASFLCIGHAIGENFTDVLHEWKAKLQQDITDLSSKMVSAGTVRPGGGGTSLFGEKKGN